MTNIFQCSKCGALYETPPGQKPKHTLLRGIHIATHEGAYCKDCECPMIQLPRAIK